MTEDQAIELRNAAGDVLRAFRKTIEDLGGCDHSVGICCCEDIRKAERLTAALYAGYNAPFCGKPLECGPHGRCLRQEKTGYACNH